MNWRLERTLAFVKGKRVLDVGCWTGEYTAEIARKSKGEVIGVDVLPSAVAKARKRQPRLRFEVRDVLRKPFPPNSFDCITFLEVIEHVDNPAGYLRAFHRMLKPGGILVISTPNAGSYFGPLRYFRSLDGKIRDIEREKQNTGTHLDHVYSWDLFTLYRILYRNGFEHVGHSFANVSLGPINLDFLTPVVGRFSTSVIIAVRKKKRSRRK
ncbi:hypothetical protein COU39_02655 [Candidatus Micrarchaeota archaeon CG10_big_fil_rev_8_21_14_0_10_60_32]|nr:MAG: hypothetical protein COU39_02655 [Candidatus Micrarchaeota archaeon CG10_big_fil_rev_8_21_14_0_10_60_32]PIO01583.1 MAG: hypothetical protein COT58_04275 [Candidatus Micrarchaeota archaeon CG09_land_8_20_14_0_10_60_16]PIY91712.1 MAG: hypothetical protein COY71_01570 [Candidatus Micrarchaeota archaeon CG_4_10_14_0_8_um_filter_60_7]